MASAKAPHEGQRQKRQARNILSMVLVTFLGRSGSNDDSERMGLDLSEHREAAYTLID